MRLVVAGIVFIFAVLTACTRQGPPEEIIVGNVPQEFTTPRDEYNTERSFDELVKPHFFAKSNRGGLVEVDGAPELIVERDGKIKVRLESDGSQRYLDLLALESGLIGEHPVHKIFRLQAMGVAVDDRLSEKLRGERFPNELFHTISFEYLPGKQTSGVITELFSDGTFLVIPFETPLDWRSTQENVAAPTHLHVNPRALSSAGSTLAQDFETQILALPTFDEKRYPPSPIALMECGVYRESVQTAAYQSVLDAIGFQFTPAHVLNGNEASTFGDKLSSLVWGGHGEGVSYFGFEPYWLADLVRSTDANVTWLNDCETASALRSYPGAEPDSNEYFLTLRRTLEPDKTKRYKIVRLDDAGWANVVYDAPGIMIMARPLPRNGDYWLISSEGWKAPDDNGPADPRWQSVYVVNTKNPDEYHIVQYPVPDFPSPPEKGTLYGGSDRLSPDANFLYNTLYGFTDEGGGLWVADLSDEEFYNDSKNFVRLLPWDHSLSTMALRNETNGDSTYTSLFLTGKEVRDDFAMTANILRVKNDGLNSTVERKERLLQMVGWNPVPFATQRLSDEKFRIGVETHFNFESSLLPRAKGVYFVPVDTLE